MLAVESKAGDRNLITKYKKISQLLNCFYIKIMVSFSVSFRVEIIFYTVKNKSQANHTT